MKPKRGSYPGEPADKEFKFLGPLMLITRPRGQAKIRSSCKILDGILPVLREGNGWRAMLHNLPPWKAVHTYFQDWSGSTTPKCIHDQLAAAD